MPFFVMEDENAVRYFTRKEKYYAGNKMPKLRRSVSGE